MLACKIRKWLLLSVVLNCVVLSHCEALIARSDNIETMNIKSPIVSFLATETNRKNTLAVPNLLEDMPEMPKMVSNKVGFENMLTTGILPVYKDKLMTDSIKREFRISENCAFPD